MGSERLAAVDVILVPCGCMFIVALSVILLGVLVDADSDCGVLELASWFSSKQPCATASVQQAHAMPSGPRTLACFLETSRGSAAAECRWAPLDPTYDRGPAFRRLHAIYVHGCAPL
jgi:hypothetical protein